MAYLSVPSPGKSISDMFGKNTFRPFCGFRNFNMFQTNGPRMAPQAKVPMQKAS